MPTIEEVLESTPNDMQDMDLNDHKSKRKQTLQLAKRGGSKAMRVMKDKAREHPIVLTSSLLLAATVSGGFPFLFYANCYGKHKHTTLETYHDNYASDYVNAKNIFGVDCPTSELVTGLTAGFLLLTFAVAAVLFYLLIRGIQQCNARTGLITCCEKQEEDNASYSRLENL